MSVSKSQIRKVMSALGSRKSEAKAKASRKNGKLGGRPKGSKNKTSTNPLKTLVKII